MNELRVSKLRTLVEQTAAEFEPSVLSALSATRAIEEWAAIEKIACAQKLRAATRAEDCGIDAETTVGDASGVSSAQARRQTQVARRATGTTKIMFERGELSPTQAGAIADAVEANPNAEDGLLKLAERGSVKELLDECERVKRGGIGDAELARRQRQARFFRSWKDGLGMTRLAARSNPCRARS